MWIIILLIVAGNVLDYASTIYALRRGAVEANPFVRINIKIVKSIGTGITAGLTILTYSVDKTMGLIIASIIFLFYAAIAYRNVRIVTRKR